MLSTSEKLATNETRLGTPLYSVSFGQLENPMRNHQSEAVWRVAKAGQLL